MLNSRLNDPIRQQTIRALSHPLTLIAVIALLVNDHILRVYWPSWITGKLGDFAWLAFFPLILAAPLAWIVPTHFNSRRVAIPALAFGITAVLFISMKTLPAALDAGLWILGQIIGGPFFLILDPTDLLTLPGLAICWWVWRQSAEPAPASRGWVVLALGALATVATTPPPPAPAVVCLIQTNEGDLYAIAYYRQVYASTDGGMTWELYEHLETMSDNQFEQQYPCKESPYWNKQDIVIKLPPRQDTVIRLTGVKAERSVDGGKTWVQELDLTHTDAQVRYYEHTYGNYNYSSPIDALIEKRTGNLIVAYGSEGVLVRSPKGQWSRIAVGMFKPIEPLSTPQRILELLGSHLLLAGVVFVLVAATIQHWSHYQHWLLIPLYGMAWACLVFITFGIFGRLMSFAEYFYRYFVPVLFVLLFVIILHAAMTKSPGRQPSHVKWLAGLTAALLFLLPLYFWSQNIIPNYEQAETVAFVLVITVLISGLVATHPAPPSEKPAKPDAPPIP